MTDRFESILDESISALQAGVSIEEILAEVPDYAPELRPLLYAANFLADPNPELVPEEKKASLRNEYMRQVAELPVITPAPFRQKAEAVLKIIKRRSTRTAILNDLITITITIILTLLVMAATINYLALDTIPGDFLYGAKRLSESIQLAVSFKSDHRLGLEEKFNRRRLSEIERLVEQKRAAVIQFRGVLETMGGNLWIVEGHTIFLSEDTRLEGDIQEGDTVEVIGLLKTNSVLVADTITRVE